MLLPLSVLLLKLSTSALPQPQHQIRAKLPRAHLLTYLPASTPPQAAVPNEQPRPGSPHPPRNPPSQWGKGVSQRQLPARRRGRRAAAQAARDERRLAEIAGCCSPPPSPTQQNLMGSGYVPDIQKRDAPLFVSSHRAGLSQVVENSSRHHCFESMRR